MVKEWKFEIHDAVWFGDRIGRVEDHAVDKDDKEIYLIQLSNHRYMWIYEKDLQEYIG